jgi:hypothetical protein
MRAVRGEARAFLAPNFTTGIATGEHPRQRARLMERFERFMIACQWSFKQKTPSLVPSSMS